ncbi:ABC transporter permease [Jiangella muralis]|uniref:ABC transporter permease n=1 Tax=Jiangella muralis TaxID=702383 RepID=UPI00069F13B0|nr:ABC transporter permease subunit [Jiangella muralis]
MSRRGSDAKYVLLLAGTVAALLVFWQLAVTRLGLVEEAFLPPPTDVGAAFVDLLGDPEFWDAFVFSLQNLFAGLALAIVVGLVVGLTVGWFPVLHFTVAPFLWLLYSTPKVALAPLFILALGLGSASKIALAFLLAVFPILLNTMEGVETVNGSLIRAGRVFGFRGPALGLKIVLPATLPFSLAGIQRGSALAFTGVVLGEFLGGAGGLGHRLEQVAFDFRMAEALAIVLVMVIVANGLLLTISAARRKWAPWYEAGVRSVG